MSMVDISKEIRSKLSEKTLPLIIDMLNGIAHQLSQDQLPSHVHEVTINAVKFYIFKFEKDKLILFQIIETDGQQRISVLSFISVTDLRDILDPGPWDSFI
ncbi:hypothetical protein L6Q79_16015 [bacterium]|nr:hypothetical protein [Candidatus Paceibacterota bacterium]MCK6544175.1 hypothetical protein [bacterium]